MSLELKYTTIKLIEEESRSDLFDSFVFNAYVKNELVGYAQLSFIPNENLSKIKHPIGYLIFKKYSDNKELKEYYQNNNKKLLLEKLATKELNITLAEIQSLDDKSIDDLYDKFSTLISLTHKKQQDSFVNYWVGKPSLDLIRVFSDKDTIITDYSNGFGVKTKRKPIDWQRKGIGLSLYKEIINWCKQNNMELWASKTQTQDAIHLWNAMEKMPQFAVSLVNTNNILQQKEASLITRKKVKIN